MKRTPAMRAARAEKRTSEWSRRNAALFADNLESQLHASLRLRRQIAERADLHASMSREDFADLMDFSAEER